MSFLSNAYGQESNTKDLLKQEIMQVEKDFQNMLKAKGVAHAFQHFAADNAVIKRENDTLIVGKQAIRNYYSSELYINAMAEWTPDFVDVSDDGKMAYTYGKYLWIFKSKDGTTKTFKGIFHTVWKRMENGSWRYVWD
jgi:ketosteroid isomerase-like protein